MYFAKYIIGGVGLNKAKIKELRSFYTHYLLEVVLPFWSKNGVDSEYGGIITSLDRKGKIYNTDKSVWFQGRAVWMFSRVYNELDDNPEWLEAASRIYKFLCSYCFDKDGRMFFTVTRGGFYV